MRKKSLFIIGLLVSLSFATSANAVSAKEHLSAKGVTMQVARTFIMDNVNSNNLATVYSTCKEFDVNNDMIAEILANDFQDLTGSVVSSYFDNNGFDGSALGFNSTTATSSYDASSATNVVDCSTLTDEIGAEAVSVLAKYNYTKCAMPFGVLVANSNTKSYQGSDMEAVTKMQATIVAELLDNNQDGVADNQSVADKLKSSATGSWMNIQSQANEANEAAIVEAMLPYVGKDMGVKYTWMESANPQSEHYEENYHFKTMMAEEAIHLLHLHGFSSVYPSVWGAADSSCSAEESSAGCDWEQSTLSKLTYEAMTSDAKWYRHGENALADSNGIITGTCSTPSCAAIEFIMNVMVELRDIKPAASELVFPSTKAEVEAKLSLTAKGQAMKSVIQDTLYAQFPNGLTYSYTPAQ